MTDEEHTERAKKITARTTKEPQAKDPRVSTERPTDPIAAAEYDADVEYLRSSKNWPVGAHNTRVCTDPKYVLKENWPGYYGRIPKQDLGAEDGEPDRPATPYEYLVKIELYNKLFDRQIELLGIVDHDGKPSFVTREPLISRTPTRVRGNS